MDNQKNDREKYLYHNTEMLLKNYRDVVWSLEVSAMQARTCIELELDDIVSDFIELPSNLESTMSEIHIEEQMRTLERNKKMLELIDDAVGILRRKQKNGEMYYWVIYFTYLSEGACGRVTDIISRIEHKVGPMAWKTYFKKRNDAISILSTILWGFTSKDCLPILEDFLILKMGNKKETKIAQMGN